MADPSAQGGTQRFTHTGPPTWAETDPPYGPYGRDEHSPRHPRRDPQPARQGERTPTRRASHLPSQGWRRWLSQITGGVVRPGPSQSEIRARHLVSCLTRAVDGSRVIAVASSKGGVGKTTTAANLGHTFAAFRTDRVIALDANPDAAGLAYRIKRETAAGVNELLTRLAGDQVHGYQDIRLFTSQATSRLEVLSSPDDPRVSRTLETHDYLRVLDTLRHYFTVILADCGTGSLGLGTQGIIQSADQLVVVTAPSIDAARTNSSMLSWLADRGHGRLVENAVVVMNGVPPRMGPVNLPAIERHFAQRVRTVVRIPWDTHLETGARTALEDLAPATRDAYLHLAASVADGFRSQERHARAH